MKLSECWKGRMVQDVYLSCEDALETNRFGHILEIQKTLRGEVKVVIGGIPPWTGDWIASPVDLKPLED